jgi:ribosomal protein L37AE/L43A
MYTCPECGEKSVKKHVERPGWYILRCEKCGAEMGPFRDAEDKGVA